MKQPNNVVHSSSIFVKQGNCRYIIRTLLVSTRWVSLSDSTMSVRSLSLAKISNKFHYTKLFLHFFYAGRVYEAKSIEDLMAQLDA